MAAAAILDNFRMAISPQRLTIYLHSAHRAVMFAIAQLSCDNRYERRNKMPLLNGSSILRKCNLVTPSRFSAGMHIHLKPVADIQVMLGFVYAFA